MAKSRSCPDEWCNSGAAVVISEAVPVEAGVGTLAYAAVVVRRGEATGEVTGALGLKYALPHKSADCPYKNTRTS